MLDKLYVARCLYGLGFWRYHNRIWMDASGIYWISNDATPNWTNVTRHLQICIKKNTHAIACGPPACNFCRRNSDLRRSCVRQEIDAIASNLNISLFPFDADVRVSGTRVWHHALMSLWWEREVSGDLKVVRPHFTPRHKLCAVYGLQEGSV